MFYGIKEFDVSLFFQGMEEEEARDEILSVNDGAEKEVGTHILFLKKSE